MIEQFRVYLDYITTNDRAFTPYNDHRETHPFDEISYYSRWLNFRSRLMYPHPPKQVMHPFRYLEGILIASTVAAPPTVLHRDIDGMCVEYYDHWL